MFEDRRERGDRRVLRTRKDVPNAGCRREHERRAILRQYHPSQPWWLQTNYAEELQPPLLDTDPTESPS